MNKRMNRREFLRFSAAAAATGVLAACAPALTSTPASPATAASAATSAAPATALPVYTPTAATNKSVSTVVFQTHWQTWYQDYLKKTAIPLFEQQNPDIKVQILWKADDPQGILTEIAGGSAPDVIQHYSSSADFFSLAPTGVFLPIENYINASNVIKKDDYVPAQWAGVTWNGHIYGLFGGDGGPWPALGWNRKMFTAAGMDPSTPPQTLDDLYSVAQKLTKLDASGNVLQMGLDIMDAEGPEVRVASMMCDSPFISADKTKILFTQGNWEDYLARFAKLVNLVTKAQYKAYSTKWTTWISNTSAFANNKEAMLIDGSWEPGAMPSAMVDKTYDIGWNFIPSFNQKKYTLMSMHQYTIPRTTKVPDAAYRWAEWLTTNQQYNLDVFNQHGNFMWSKSLVKQYDVSKAPGLAWFLDAPNQADKVFGPADFGCLVSGELSKLFAQAQQFVAYGTKTPKQALADITATLQQDLDAAWKAIS